MITEFISMNGYGLYVWFSFGIVIISCAIVYYKTKKTLKKYEKEFLVELEALSVKEKNRALRTSKVAQQILAASSRVN
ncbi:MAG: heme exporter protein CcmD [Pelagibacteraceae bacterium]|jgi:heme exporter protein CcmD|nr:heme exporter protein CcmD [Pelagibacteraceae bacterium]